MQMKNLEFDEDESDAVEIPRRLSNDITYEKTKNLFNVFFVKKINQPELIPYMHTTYELISQLFKLISGFFVKKEQSYNEYLEYLEKENKDQSFLEKKIVKKFNEKKGQTKINAIIILGGDGTVLHACSLFQSQTTPPILAFNKVLKGTLSFMCNYDFKQYKEMLEKIFFKIQETKIVKVDIRMRIDCRIYESQNQKRLIRGHYSALNDIVIDRGSNPFPIKLEIYINNEIFTVAAGDGIIFSTPSGSSAYALSAGGPLIHTAVKTIEMTPICPLSLSFRPILFPDNVIITIKLAQGTRNTAFLSADGKKKIEVGLDDVIQITTSKHNVQSYFLKKFLIINNFYSHIRTTDALTDKYLGRKIIIHAELEYKI